VLYALLFLPAIVAIAYVVLVRGRPEPPKVLAEAVPPPAAQISGDPDPLQALETLLGELERATLDERDVEELERLAEQLELTARELELVSE
jgi:hypothetical protein